MMKEERKGGEAWYMIGWGGRCGAKGKRDVKKRRKMETYE